MENKNIRIWSLPFILSMLIGGLTFGSFFLAEPNIAGYSIHLGTDLVQAGTIAGLLAFAALGFRPFCGIIASRINAKILLSITTTIMAVGVFGYAFSTNIKLLILFRCIEAIGFSLNSTIGVSFAASFIPRDKINEGLGYYGMCSMIFSTLAPSLGLTITKVFGFKNMFIITASLLCVCSVIAMFIPSNEPIFKEKNEKKKLNINNFISIKVLPIALFTAILSIGNGIVTSYLALLGEVRQIAGISIYFTITALIMLSTRTLIGKLADKGKNNIIIFIGMISDAVGLFLIGIATTLTHIFPAAIFKALGQGASGSTLQVKAISKLPKEQSSIASSTYYIGADIGQGFGPIFAGLIVSSYGTSSTSYATMFSIISTLVLMGAFGFYIYSKYESKEKTFTKPKQ